MPVQPEFNVWTLDDVFEKHYKKVTVRLFYDSSILLLMIRFVCLLFCNYNMFHFNPVSVLVCLVLFGVRRDNLPQQWKTK